MNGAQLSRAIDESESKWDDRVGGLATRPWRELLAYCVGKLVFAEVDPQAVVDYVAQMVSMAAAFNEDDDAGGGNPA